jgi:hypothetical protein
MAFECLRDNTVLRLEVSYKCFSTDRGEFTANAALERRYVEHKFLFLFFSSSCYKRLGISTSFEFSTILYVVYFVVFICRSVLQSYIQVPVFVRPFEIFRSGTIFISMFM